MTTTQVIWLVVIVVAALALIGLVVSSMRKKSQQDNRARASQLREQADTQAAGLPDARASAEQAETKAEQARLEAQRAEEQAASARTEVAQQQATHEDQIRAADRLDPDVKHTAKDYAPEVGTPVGPSAIPTDPDTIFDRDEEADGQTGGSHRA